MLWGNGGVGDRIEGGVAGARGSVDDRRERIREDLSGFLEGDLHFDTIGRSAYGVDGGLLEVEPLGVVAPRNAEEARLCLLYAAEQGLPVHARGGGTGLSGGALGPGLVLDFSRHLRRVLEIREDSVVAEAGVVPELLNRALAPRGRRLGVECDGAEACTVGGMVARDAAGRRGAREGSAGDHLRSARVIFADGSEALLKRGPRPDPERDPAELDFLEALGRKIVGLGQRMGCAEDEEGAAEGTGEGEGEGQGVGRGAARRRGPGYALREALRGDGLDLGRLMAGSEGTLGLLTEVELGTVAIPRARGAALFQFERLTDAAAAARELGGPWLSACELHDWRSLSLLRESNRPMREGFVGAARAALVAEFESDDPRDLERWLRATATRVARSARLVADPFATTRAEDVDRLTGLRRVLEGLLLRRRSSARPLPLFEELRVPPESLEEAVVEFQSVLKRHAASWTLHAHAAEGRLHPRPFLDPADPRDAAKVEPLVIEIAERVIDRGGWVKGGLELIEPAARFRLRARQFGNWHHVHREIKTAFDPEDRLNPGRIAGGEAGGARPRLRAQPAVARSVGAGVGVGVGEDSAWETPAAGWETGLGGSSGEIATLGGGGGGAGSGAGSGSWAVAGGPGSVSGEGGARRRGMGRGGAKPVAALPVLEESLIWPEGERGLLETVAACNGCGLCRSQAPEGRMCPSFRARLTEESSPRGQANLLRNIATGGLDAGLWGSEELRRRADLCLHCGLCREECPAGVDVSRLMMEAKAAYVFNHGIGLGDLMISRLEVWARWAAQAPGLGNRLLGSGMARAALERLGGLSRLRSMPRFRKPSFPRRARELGLTRPRPEVPGPRVAYFPDVFANYFDPELAETVTRLLTHFGVNVYVPTPQRGSGMAALVVGDVEYAREIARANLRALGAAVREGYTVVCSEPTASMMIRQEYPRLTEDRDAELVAARTRDAGEYLAELDARGLLPEPTEAVPGRAGYHQPCHLRAQNVGTPGLDLLRRIPELRVEFIDRGCSGMAGTHGLSGRNFRASLRAGRGLRSRLRDPDIEFGTTECGACRMQMEQGVTKRTFHPLKLLALAYGLRPDLRGLLREPKAKNEIA